jgi:hypothetical protein
VPPQGVPPSHLNCRARPDSLSRTTDTAHKKFVSDMYAKENIYPSYIAKLYCTYIHCIDM